MADKTKPDAGQQAPERQQAIDAGIPAHTVDLAAQRGFSLLELIRLVRKYGPVAGEMFGDVMALWTKYGDQFRKFVEELFGSGSSLPDPAHAKQAGT